MKFSPIYAALLTSLAGISTAHAAQISQNIADEYGAAGISPHLKCLVTNPHGASRFYTHKPSIQFVLHIAD